MPDPIFVEGGILVPAESMEMKAVRASGPGGQNVNKVSSKVELRVDLNLIRGIDTASRRRLHHLVARRLDSDGRLVVTSQRSRDQYHNLQDARRKIHDYIAKALNPPKKRTPTQPSRAALERRLATKHLRSQRKRERQEIPEIDD
jgi:ribosome-associated protein